MLVADFCFVDCPSTRSSSSQHTQARFLHSLPPLRTATKPSSYTNIPYQLLSSVQSPTSHIRAYSTLSIQKAYCTLISTRQYSQSTTKRAVKPTPAGTATDKLTHLDSAGAAHMVDISHKKETTRLATAVATLLFSRPETHSALSSQTVAKGDAIAVARIAAIQAAKKTSDLIPLAHPSLNITGINVDIEGFGGDVQGFVSTKLRRGQEVSRLESSSGGVTVRATVKCQGKTGVEMEAITAATMGAVTLYDMLKAVDKGMVITGARVVEKQGGKSGDWVWHEGENRLVRPGSQEASGPQVQMEKQQVEGAPLSEVEEWNKGLAAEFSIMDEVEALEERNRHR